MISNEHKLHDAARKTGGYTIKVCVTEQIISSPIGDVSDGVIRTMTEHLPVAVSHLDTIAYINNVRMAILWELTSIWSGQYRINASIGDAPAFYLIIGGVKRAPFDDETIQKSAICTSWRS